MVKLKKGLRAVKDIELSGKDRVSEILEMMKKAGGFVGRELGEGIDILERMVKDDSCTTFLSFPAAPVATGLRGVLKELVKRKLAQVVITTSGTLDHEVARSWSNYYQGSFHLDDSELYKKGFHRLGSVLIPKECYGPPIEKKLQPFLENLYRRGKKELCSSELVSYLGEWLNDEASILYWASKNKIPVFVPGIIDGAVGSQLWLFFQRHRDFKVDLLKDEQILADIVYSAKRTGALMIGGGITKHHTLWWNQFRGGLDYAVLITTAVEYDGSLSGAEVREAVSWGKVGLRARHVTIHGEATALLPFMVASLLERLGT